MNNRNRFVFFTLFATATMVNTLSAHAAGSRFLCGNERIREGDSMHEIRLDCGEPVSEMPIGEKIIFSRHKRDHKHVEEIRYITEWIYDQGEFIYTLTFEGSTLSKTVARRR